ncbi:unnamed protein product [Thelazia callipaeda]|uniref:S1 motif domain-containing protein n=1 Tax=Thelazia callipaeda TaxID=103827 RepID=A0A0N5CZX8_THECL|nr:unnamed protein product [Thelazia callipaeda]
MCKHFGLVSNADHVTGSLHVFVPGRHPDFVFSSQERVGNSKLQVGDFVSFVEVGGVIKSLSRIDDVFEKRHKNGVLQVKVSVAFPPECTHPETGLMSGMLAWSPDFAFIGCLDICVSDYNSNQMYMAWIQRCV